MANSPKAPADPIDARLVRRLADILTETGLSEIEVEHAGLTHVAGLVAALGLDPRKVAVERNLEIVPRSAYGRTPIAEGDRIEIVSFIGGG